MRVRANQAVAHFENPEVLVRQAVLEIGDARREVYQQLHRSKTAEISARSQVEQARSDAALYRRRAASQLATGDERGAGLTMQRAMLKDYESETVAAHLEQMREMNERLETALVELDNQAQVISMLATIEQSRWHAAVASRAATESRYGSPSSGGESPYSKLEDARRRANEIMAGAMATVQLGQLLPDTNDSTPDFRYDAQIALAEIKASEALGPGEGPSEALGSGTGLASAPTEPPAAS
jgi:phage shock protein A